MLGGGGDKVSAVPVFYLRGTVSVSSLGSFSSVGSSSKPSYLSLPLSLGVHCIQDYFNNRRGRKLKYIDPQEDKARREQNIRQTKVKFQEKLVVGYWGLVPME